MFAKTGQVALGIPAIFYSGIFPASFLSKSDTLFDCHAGGA
jgi:hypothetical protein